MKNSLKFKSVIIFNLIFAVAGSAAQNSQSKTAAVSTAKVAASREITSEKFSVDDKAKAEEFFKKGQEYWKNFDISETIDSYTKALQFYPNYPDALRERGKVYSMIGRNQEAIKDLSAFLKIQPNSADSLNYRGLAYSAITEELVDYEIDLKKAAENADEALTDFNRAIELEPQTVVFYNNRARLYIIFSDYKEAIVDLEKAVRLDSKSAISHSNLGIAKFYAQSGTGLPELNRSIELNPNYAEVFYNRAGIYRSAFSLEKAIADYTKAISLNDDPKYYNARGTTHYIGGDSVAAVKDFTSAINKKKDYARAYLNRAMTYKKFPESAAAEKAEFAEIIIAQIAKMKADLDAAIRYNPNLADAYLERGNAALPSIESSTNGSHNEKESTKIRAIFADFDKAIQLDPKLAEAYNGRAICQEELGKKDSALADYNKAIELNPRLGTAYLGRMAIYCEMGKVELSIADEKKVKELGLAAINMCSFRK